MTAIKRFSALLIVACGLVVAGCEVFQDQTPEFINFRMDGTAGDTIMVIYSTAFVAGVNEEGITRVEVFEADTVRHVLPIDTVLDVRVPQRLFLQGEVSITDTLDVNVLVDVDGRSLFDGAGELFPGVPWQFIYQFNTPFTDDIEVII